MRQPRSSLAYCCTTLEKAQLHKALGVHITEPLARAVPPEYRRMSPWKGYIYALLDRSEGVEIILGAPQAEWMNAAFKPMRRSGITYAFAHVGFVAQDEVRYNCEAFAMEPEPPTPFRRACKSLVRSVLAGFRVPQAVVSTHAYAYTLHGHTLALAIVDRAMPVVASLFSEAVATPPGLLEFVQRYAALPAENQEALAQLYTWQPEHWDVGAVPDKDVESERYKLRRFLGVHGKASLRRPTFAVHTVLKWGALRVRLVPSIVGLAALPDESWFELRVEIPVPGGVNARKARVLGRLSCNFLHLNKLGYLANARRIDPLCADDIAYLLEYTLECFNVHVDWSRERLAEFAAEPQLITLRGAGNLAAEATEILGTLQTLLDSATTTPVGVYRLLDNLALLDAEAKCALRLAFNMLEQMLSVKYNAVGTTLGQRRCLYCRLPAAFEFMGLRGMTFCEVSCAQNALAYWVVHHPQLLGVVNKIG